MATYIFSVTVENSTTQVNATPTDNGEWECTLSAGGQCVDTLTLPSLAEAAAWALEWAVPGAGG